MTTDLQDRPDDEFGDDDDFELPDLPDPEDLIEGEVPNIDEAPKEHPNPDVRALDEMLRNVSMRNYVYSHEILEHLPDNPYSEYAYEELSKNVLLVHDGDKLLFSRDYLNVLLDYRNVLTASDPQPTEVEPIEA